MEQKEFYYQGKKFSFRKNFNESFCLLALKGALEKEDAVEFENNVINVLKKIPETYEMLKTQDTLLDCSLTKNADHEARRIFTQLAKEFPNSFLAAFGTNSIIRVIIGFLLTASRRKNIKFFATKEQAVDWLEKSRDKSGR